MRVSREEEGGRGDEVIVQREGQWCLCGGLAAALWQISSGSVADQRGKVCQLSERGSSGYAYTFFSRSPRVGCATGNIGVRYA
jgi:hypothetical protein